MRSEEEIRRTLADWDVSFENASGAADISYIDGQRNALIWVLGDQMDQDCHNCEHRNSDDSEEPCLTCTTITRYTHWEPVLAQLHVAEDEMTKSCKYNKKIPCDLDECRETNMFFCKRCWTHLINNRS